MPETELDARILPKPVRHKTIFETFAKLGEIATDNPSGIFFTSRAARIGF